MFIATYHATQRFIERFAGNLSEPKARITLEKIARTAWYAGEMPGHARLYTNKHVALVIKDRYITTVYPRSTATGSSRAPRFLEHDSHYPIEISTEGN